MEFHLTISGATSRWRYLLKSVSGLYFPSRGSFRNFQLCPREERKGRTAPYDEAKARKYGILE